jgi:Protein of unknown function (DUF3301)
MELGWGALVLLLAAAAVIWFLQDSLAVRERANAAAMEACRRLSLQFLDGTVAFARLTFIRERGQLALRRTYVFDYTANSIERRQGFVILVGRRVESVGYAPGEEQRAQRSVQPPVTVSVSTPLPPDPEPVPPATPANNSAVVLDLAEWRQRRRGTEQQPSPRRAGNSAGDTGNGQDSHP